MCRTKTERKRKIIYVRRPESQQELPKNEGDSSRSYGLEDDLPMNGPALEQKDKENVSLSDLHK